MSRLSRDISLNLSSTPRISSRRAKTDPDWRSDRRDVNDDDDEEKQAGHAVVILPGDEALCPDPPLPRLNCLLSRSRGC